MSFTSGIVAKYLRSAGFDATVKSKATKRSSGMVETDKFIVVVYPTEMTVVLNRHCEMSRGMTELHQILDFVTPR